MDDGNWKELWAMLYAYVLCNQTIINRTITYKKYFRL